MTELLKEHNIDQFALQEHIARVGVSVDLRPRDNLERELGYGNHSGARKHAGEVWEKAVGYVNTGRGIVTMMPARLARMMRGLWINPVGMVEEKG